MITLLGVGHVFDLGAAIRGEIHRRRPRVVGLELDPGRFAALEAGGRPRGGPPVYRLLAALQRLVAGQGGTRVGQEMVEGARAAREVGAAVAFLDLEGTYIWRRLWQAMTLREKARLLAGIATGLVAGRGGVDEELERYRSNPGGYLEAFAHAFPSVKRVLLDERNDHMARVLRDLHGRHGDVVAIVGDGHIEGLVQRLEGDPLEVVRLWELQGGSGGSPSVGLSFELRGGPPPAP